MTGLPGLLSEDRQSIISGLTGRAEQLRGAHVLVTGASGFVGRWLTEALTAINQEFRLGMRLTLVARDAERLRRSVAHLEHSGGVSLLSQDVRELCVAEQPTHVIHAAATASAQLNELQPEEMISVIVDGTRRVLAQTLGAERILFVSSGAVYGTQAPALVEETCVLGPDLSSSRSAYGEAKRLAEVLCLANAARTNRAVTIARGFAFVGPHLPLDTHFAVGNFLRDGMAGRAVVVQGDGSPRRSYLHAADLAQWLITILVQGERGRAFNVGSDVAVSIAQLASDVAELFGVDVEVRGTHRPGMPVHMYVPSLARSRAELGLDVTIPFREALARTVRWCRRQ